jgi:hypothetical protein
MSLQYHSQRAAQKAATATLETTTVNAAASTTAAIEQPEHAPRSQQPATDDGTQPLEAGAIIVEPVSPIAQPEPLPKVGKEQTRSKRARRRTKKASDITTTLLETAPPKSAAFKIEDGTHPLTADAMAKMPTSDAVTPEEIIKLGQKALTRPQHKKMRAKAALNNAPSSGVETTAARQTATIKDAPAKIPPINATASKPPPAKIRASQPPRARTVASKTAWMLRNTGTLVRTIAAASLEPDSTEVSSKDGFETLCSYNWQMDGTIFVPGGPPKWTPPHLPVTLPPDTGRHFMDQNAHRVPKYPFEPAFHALSIMNPNMSLNTVDIVANRNSFRKLIEFAAGWRRDPWCMGLHMVNNTLFISRKEKNAIQMIHGSANSGYGHNFEKAFTKPQEDMESSSSHHRVIRYHIGPLDCVVRFEVDAYYDDPDAADAVEPDEDLTNAMAQLDMQDQPQTKSTHQQKSSADKTTKAIQKGTLINPSKLAEIKAKRFDRLNEALPQLWFGRTPWFMNGNHNKGKFHSVTIAHAKDLYPQWEEANQERLRKMVSLLGDLKSAAAGVKGRAAVLVYEEKGGDLGIYEMQRVGGVLPREIIRRHLSV